VLYFGQDVPVFGKAFVVVDYCGKIIALCCLYVSNLVVEGTHLIGFINHFLNFLLDFVSFLGDVYWPNLIFCQYVLAFLYSQLIFLSCIYYCFCLNVFFARVKDDFNAAPMIYLIIQKLTAMEGKVKLRLIEKLTSKSNHIWKMQGQIIHQFSRSLAGPRNINHQIWFIQIFDYKVCFILKLSLFHSVIDLKQLQFLKFKTLNNLSPNYRIFRHNKHLSHFKFLQ
jgi:hypothetical protein